MWFREPHLSPERSSPTRLSTSGQPSYIGRWCGLQNVDSYSPVHTPQKSWTLINVAGRTSDLASIFFSTKSKTLAIQLQDKKCLQVREVVQQLAIDMYQRLLPQGKMSFKQMTPFYLPTAKVKDVWSFTTTPSYTCRVNNLISGKIFLCKLPCKWCYNVSYGWDIYPFFSRSPSLSRSLKYTALFI